MNLEQARRLAAVVAILMFSQAISACFFIREEGIDPVSTPAIMAGRPSDEIEAVPGYTPLCGAGYVGAEAIETGIVISAGALTLPPGSIRCDEGDYDVVFRVARVSEARFAELDESQADDHPWELGEYRFAKSDGSASFPIPAPAGADEVLLIHVAPGRLAASGLHPFAFGIFPDGSIVFMGEQP